MSTPDSLADQLQAAGFTIGRFQPLIQVGGECRVVLLDIALKILEQAEKCDKCAETTKLAADSQREANLSWDAVDEAYETLVPDHSIPRARFWLKVAERIAELERRLGEMREVYLLRLPLLSPEFCAATTNKAIADAFAAEMDDDDAENEAVVSLILEDFSYFTQEARKRWGVPEQALAHGAEGKGETGA